MSLDSRTRVQRRRNIFPDLENGLTPTGIDFVEEMERLGIVIDLSHLNDAGIL